MKTILIVLFAVAIAAAVDVPKDWKICRRSDPKVFECIARAAMDVTRSLASGSKTFKILPLEPLAVDSIKIGESNQGAATVRQEYHNIKLYGLTKGLQLANYKVDWNKPTLMFDAYNPQVDFVADYKVEGRILLLPIHGSGKSNITMYDLKTHTEIQCERFQKNGETYIRVKKYTVKFSPEKVKMRFENLFNGDSVLGEQMNRFINENSDLLFKELQPPYEESFGLVFAKITNDIFSRVPMNKLFPE